MAVSPTSPRHECPLCINAHEARRGATIFLDVNVLFKECPIDYCEYVAKKYLDPEALSHLDALIAKVQQKFRVHIVVTGFWSKAGTINELRDNIFATYSFAKCIVGKQPPANNEDAPEIKMGDRFESICAKKYGWNFYYPKGKIDYWLRKHKFEESNFVVMGSEGSLDAFSQRHIPVSNLLSKTEAEKAADRLLTADKQWHTLHNTEFRNESEREIRKSFPYRLMVDGNTFCYRDRNVNTTKLLEIAAEKVSRSYSKLLTPKGFRDRSILMTFTGSPTEFPSAETVTNFKKRLTTKIRDQLLKLKELQSKECVEISRGYLKEILETCQISSDYFPADTLTKIRVNARGSISLVVGEGSMGLALKA